MVQMEPTGDNIRWRFTAPSGGFFSIRMTRMIKNAFCPTAYLSFIIQKKAVHGHGLILVGGPYFKGRSVG